MYICEEGKKPSRVTCYCTRSRACMHFRTRVRHVALAYRREIERERDREEGTEWERGTRGKGKSCQSVMSVCLVRGSAIEVSE